MILGGVRHQYAVVNGGNSVEGVWFADINDAGMWSDRLEIAARWNLRGFIVGLTS